MRTVLKISVLALAGSVAASAALAGGYSRGEANLDGLLGGNTGLASGLSVVSPTRSYSSVNGVATTGNGAGDFAGTYENYFATANAKITDDLRCAGSMAQPFGASSNYGQAQIAAGVGSTTAAELESTELGATCSYGFNAGPGRAYVLGGLFYQTVNYTETRGGIVPGLGFVDNVANIDLSDSEMGYRLGVGFTIDEIALKTSLMYRSAVDHRVTGLQTLTPIAAAGAAATLGNPALAALLAGNYGTYADVTTPQSVKFSFQSGIAENTLLFGSVTWTDWSIAQQVNVLGDGTGSALAAANFNNAPTPGAPTIDAFFRDGWTANIGVGRKLTDVVSVAGSYTYDRGTSTGRSGFGDTHTFAFGTSLTAGENATLRAGVAYTVLGSATELNSDGQTIVYDRSHAIAGGASFNVSF